MYGSFKTYLFFPYSSPSPCGKNTQCSVDYGNGQVLCSCLPGYEKGDPTSAEGCSPECSEDIHCPADRACINLRCVDTCPGSCGLGAECKLIDHR